MRIRLSVLFFLILQVSFSQSIPSSSGVTYERNDDKSITFTYNGETSGTTYVILNLNQLTNTYSPGTIKKSVKGFSGVLKTIEPSNKEQHINFSYSYRAISGDVNAKPDTQFKYVLPFLNGKEIKVRDLSFLGNRIGGTQPKNFRSFQFLVEPNAAVCSIRKGVVVRITNGNNASSKNVYGYRNKSNSILIEHNDGTMALYDVLKKDSFRVEVGDIVYPSTPLAVAGTYDKEENSQVRLSVYYLDKVVKDYDFSQRKNESLSNITHLYAYVDPMFIVNSDGSGLMKLKSNEAYTSFSNEGIIQLEMSNREKKKYLKRKI